MKKVKWLTSVLIVCSLIGLTGCSEKTAKEKELEKKVAELQQQIDELKREKEKAEKEQAPEEKGEQEEQTGLVEVINPLTKEIIKTIDPKEMGYLTDRTAYEKEIAEWAKNAARGTKQAEGFDQRMYPDKIGADGQVIKGKPRMILEESDLVSKVIEASEKGGKVELPLTVSASGYKPDEAALLGEVVIASYTTQFDSSVAGRSKNVELSADAINNVIVGVGDIFSFNTTVGPSDAEHGYQKAKEAVGGKLVDGIGGGICQTSSTLYNAVDQIGVSYVEKHHHSVHVGYVPTGRDATVSYGGLDFRFQNSTTAPFLLKAYVKNGSLTVEVRTSKAHKGEFTVH
ncbi:VanW family protein [Falsibacillus pallidus]|uniref:VanW family protein n=1 Tax=Falsibacillus pallidus TaxID=493781 RepID=UPI003D952D47